VRIIFSTLLRLLLVLLRFLGRLFLARDVIYTYRAYATMSVSVCLSVCPSVCDGNALGRGARREEGEGSSRAMLASVRPSCFYFLPLFFPFMAQ